jgi:hypothetical protein
MRFVQTDFQVKILQIIFVLSFVIGLQHKVFAGSFSVPSSESSHLHESELNSVFEMIEVLFTGHMVHTHDHQEHDEDSHSHSHQHQFGGSFTLKDFLFFQMHLSFSSLKQIWTLEIKVPRLNPFYFEILRPPIFDCAVV